MYGRIRRVCLFLFETRRIHAEKSIAVITCTRSVLLKLKRLTFGSKLNITIKGFPKCNFFFNTFSVILFSFAISYTRHYWKKNNRFVSNSTGWNKKIVTGWSLVWVSRYLVLTNFGRDAFGLVFRRWSRSFNPVVVSRLRVKNNILCTKKQYFCSFTSKSKY